jgi:hypothetical protein
MDSGEFAGTEAKRNRPNQRFGPRHQFPIGVELIEDPLFQFALVQVLPVVPNAAVVGLEPHTGLFELFVNFVGIRGHFFLHYVFPIGLRPDQSPKHSGLKPSTRARTVLPLREGGGGKDLLGGHVGGSGDLPIWVNDFPAI